MALYPKLFVTYLGWFLPGMGQGTLWAIGLAMVWIATAINLRGSDRVGRGSVWAGAFILGGFLVVALLALPQAAHVPWRPFSAPGGEGSGMHGLGVGLSIALWNYIGWDNASTVQGEVRDASRTYPRALAIALPVVAAGYLVPLLAALSATDWTTWTEGGWPAIARTIGGSTMGPVLAAWIAVGGMVSAVALFNALLLAYSRIPFVMAEDGLLPAALAETDARGTPRRAVLVSAVCYSVVMLLPFADLVVADVLLYSLALVLELASLVRLRVREPGLRGAFRIPVGTAGVVALAMLPAATMLLVVGLSLADGEYGAPALAGAGLVIALGPVAYRIAGRGRDGVGTE
jgi:amino acid transporter